MKKVCLSVLSVQLFACAQQAEFWDGRARMLRGVAVGNNVWSLQENVDPKMNDRTDYVRMRALGMNAVRFYLSYTFFESDSAPYQYKQGGWDFVDQNLAWAKENGISLILNMHVPQGGFQSNAGGAALWDVEDNQKRLVALWREIARRYADEPAVAAYDILNEPVVTRDKSQWQSLAQRIVNAIREVDGRHLIYVERINGIIPGNWSNDAEMNFVFITDPADRWGLTFHCYSPMAFTHQYASWILSLKDSDGGKYPDPGLPQFEHDVWKGATFESPALPHGDSGWAFYEGAWKTITDTAAANIGRPSLQCDRLGEGTVWFDSIVFEKRSPSGEVTTLATHRFPFGGGWYFWKEKDGGRIIEGENAIGFTGTAAAANYSANKTFVMLEQGCSYRVSGRMRGENVPDVAACRVRFDWHHARSISVRDKAALEREILAYLNVAREKNLPVYLGEFGVIKHALTEEKGGAVWIADMIDILKSRDVPFTYHAWVDTWFGVKGNARVEQVFQAALR